MLLECCVDTLASARAAALGGADRLELCARLDIGGITPGATTLDAALAELAIPVFPMVRPRGGDFCYSGEEIAAMISELRRLRGSGVPGAVVGALSATGDVDRDTMARCRDAAGPHMQLTFHRAFDAARDPAAALDTLIELGFSRILTSGQRDTAWDGRDLIAELVRQATGRIVVMAGGKVTAEKAATLARVTSVSEVHFRTADGEKVRAVREALRRGQSPDDESAAVPAVSVRLR
jgi:copper homeostasis protein